MAGKRKEGVEAMLEAAKKVLREIRPAIAKARGSAWRKAILEKIDAILGPPE